MVENIKAFANTQPILFSGLIATLVLGTAFTFQAFGYPPCDLCWWQRYPYMAIMGASILATGIKSLPKKVTLLLLMALFIADAGIAGFHVGVEQRWWEGLSTCSGFVDYTDDINTALQNIMDAPLIKCDEIAWSLFGVSMAGYNFLIATGMALFCANAYKKA